MVEPSQPQRVAVVGGGIAGCGAAWSLARAGVEVELFEAAPTLGGNAKTHLWSVGEGEQAREIRTGLSVLAWPKRLFRNYERLLAELGVETCPVELRFFIRRGDERFVQGRDCALARRHAEDIRRWRRLRRLVGWVNRVFHGFPSEPSLYHQAALNPMNLIPLRTLARLLGVSAGFWTDIIVPLYSTSFLSTKLDAVPAVILPTLDAIVPLELPATMQTWRGSSAAVFEALSAGLARVHTSCAITRIEAGPAAGFEGVELGDAQGRSHRFDAAVLACPAPATDAALVHRRRLHDLLLRGQSYADDHDPTFVEGLAHSDGEVIPEADRAEALADCCNYVEVERGPDPRRDPARYTNHFVLSSWVPAAQQSGATMLVSYNRRPEAEIAGPTRTISNRRAHPDLSVANLSRALCYRFLQGKDRLYYCGSCVTPGNGHDLSLLSGFAVAERLGAPYPFADDEGARADFERLRRMMFGRR